MSRKARVILRQQNSQIQSNSESLSLMARKRLNSFNLTESQLRRHYESFNTISPKQFI